MIIGSRAVLKTVGRDERLGGSSPSASAKKMRLMKVGLMANDINQTHHQTTV